MKCPYCNADNTDVSKFCVKCGKELKGGPAPMFCSKCGASLKAGSKFCTKCGTPINSPSQPNAVNPASVQKPAPSAVQSPVQKTDTPPIKTTATPSVRKEAGTPNQSHPDHQVKQNFFQSTKGLILIIALVIVALIVAILLVLKSFGFFSKSGEIQPEVIPEETSDISDMTENEQESEEDSIDPETLKEIENIKNEIKSYVDAGDGSEDVNGYYPGALDRYIVLASEYDMAEDIRDEASEVFDKYAAQTRYSASLLTQQAEIGVNSGLYTQTRIYYDELLEYADKLEKAGISVDCEDIRESSDGLIDFYRSKYIEQINAITEREQWSRDEAWNTARDAASIVDKDGKTVLFDFDDLDDPLRLRYIFCEAMAARKEVELGIAGGTLSAEGALDIIDSKLEETDYNPQLVFDAISYCNAGGLDSAPYTVAFNSIMDRLSNTDGIILVPTPDDAVDNRVDINHFWYFNDISSDADREYQVNSFNGTTSDTRAWIRDNIRINRIEN